MLLRAVQVQGPTLVSVADAKACVQTLAEMQERLSRRSRRLTAATIVLVGTCSVAAMLGAVAVTVAWAAGELGAAGRVAELAADTRKPLWLAAGVVAAAAAVTGLLEHRASCAAAVVGDGARTLEGLAVEVVAVRSVLATGVTRERCARAAASLRYQTLDGATRTSSGRSTRPGSSRRSRGSAARASWIRRSARRAPGSAAAGSAAAQDDGPIDNETRQRSTTMQTKTSPTFHTTDDAGIDAMFDTRDGAAARDSGRGRRRGRHTRNRRAIAAQTRDGARHIARALASR